MHNHFSSQEFYYYAGATIKFVLGLAVMFLGEALIWMLLFSDTTAIGTADIFWVFYLHMSATVTALACYFLMSMSSLWLLISKKSFFAPIIAMASAPTGFYMTLFALGTGALFGRPVWGSYWVWDARLSGLMLLIFFFGAFLTFAAPRGMKHRRTTDVRAAIAALSGIILVPVFYFLFDLLAPMRHEFDKILVTSNGVDPQVLIVSFTLCLVCYAMAMILARCRTLILERDHRSSWAQDEALEGNL